VDRELLIDGWTYRMEVTRKVSFDADAPRLAVVSRQQNGMGMDLVRTCIRAVQHFTPEPHELWVIDNNSPRENLNWLMEWPDVNIVLNRTEPFPQVAREATDAEPHPDNQLTWDSYANAIGLEIAVRLIDPKSSYLMSLHMDTMPCTEGWLSYLQSKIKRNVRASGVRMDKTRTPEGVLHVLGYMVDFQLFKNLGLDYFPDLPRFDVGDRVTVRLREAGYDVFACPNTLWEPELAEKIPQGSPLREFGVDRSLDDDEKVIFMHLGRGVRKSIGVHTRGTMIEEWVRLANRHLLV
jgi:hypothetical protein